MLNYSPDDHVKALLRAGMIENRPYTDAEKLGLFEKAFGKPKSEPEFSGIRFMTEPNDTTGILQKESNTHG